MSDEEIPQSHKEAEKRAQFFDAMAARIRLNKDATFGGAFVVVSPDMEQSTEMLILNQQEAGVFWAALQTLAQQAVASIDKVQRGMGYGR
jgi:hypothetical protein